MRRSLFLALAALAGCAVAEAPLVEVIVQIVDDEGAPLQGAAVSVGNQWSGRTDENGRYGFEAPLPDGLRLSMEVECPEGYSPVSPAPETVRIRHLEATPDGGPALAPIRREAACAPRIRSHVLIIRTDGRPDLPVEVTGGLLTETDRQGIAHVAVSGAPGDEIRVVIDTSARPELRPSSPSRRLVLPPRSRFLVFEQSFEERVEKRRRKKKRRRFAGPRRL